MAMIHEVQVGSLGRSGEIGTSMNDRVAMSRTQARRRWILRSMLLLSVAGGAFLFMLVYWRDSNAVETHKRAMQVAVVALQEKIDTLDMLPAVPPLPGAPYKRMPSYASASTRFYAKHTTEPVIIAVTSRISRILGPDGVVAIIYENGEVRRQWFSQADFEKAYDAQSQRIDAFEARQRLRASNLPE